MTSNAAPEKVSVSAKRLRICLESANFWVDELPAYADRNQRRADRYAIASGTIAALTGLAIWPVLTTHSSNWAKAAVSGATLLAAIFALVPRIKNYADNAGQARELSRRYGDLRGKLIDLTEPGGYDAGEAQAVIAEFQAAKEKKDLLRALPDRAKTETRQAKIRQLQAAAEQTTAQVERAAAEAKTAAAGAAEAAANAERKAAGANTTNS